MDVESVRLEGIHKSFDGVRAVQGVDLSLRAGEVHALVGANGAGKSTLAKIIAGVLAPDRGRVVIAGRVSEHPSPAAHARLGVGVLYQEATIVPRMSAAGNALLGRLRRRGPFLDRGRMRRDFQAHCRRVGVSIDPGVPAGELPVASQRMLEIIRALDSGRDVLVMDEPTGSLGPAERDHFYTVVRDLLLRGVSVLYISHDLEEVLKVSDRVSVMRDGLLVETRPVAAWTKLDVVRAMLGRDLTVRPKPRPVPSDELALRVVDVSLPGRLWNVSFELRRGEILGLAGLVGSGRSELLRSLAGVEPAATGTLILGGLRRPLPRSVPEALRLGIAMTPEDRLRDGIVPLMDGDSNIVLSGLREVSRGGVIDVRRRWSAAERVARSIGLPERMLRRQARALSGGNQQKLVVGRWIHRAPPVLLLDDPTVGIDVGAKRELLDLLRRLASGGVSIVFVSSEWEELLETCDRLLVLASGRVVGELSHEGATAGHILELIFGVQATG